MKWIRMNQQRHERLEAAYQEYQSRQSRDSHPDGAFDSKGRWYPSDGEACECCGAIRTPSRAYPLSLNKHCRSIEHVASVFDVDEKFLRKRVKADQPARTVQKHVRFKAVAVVNGEFVSIFDGSPWAINKTRREAVPQTFVYPYDSMEYPVVEHTGGFYVYETAEEAQKAAVPTTSKHADVERAILKVEVWGRSVSYGHGKQAWSFCKPLETVETVENSETE